MHRIAFRLFLVFVATIPLNAALELGAVGSLNKWIGLAAGGAWATKVLVDRGFRQLQLFHVIAIAFLVFGVVSLATYSSGVLAGVETLPLLAALVVMVWDLARKRPEIHLTLQAFVLGALGASLSLVFNYRSGIDYSGFQTSVDAQTVRRFAASGTDPNELGVMLALSMLFAAYLLAHGSSGHVLLRWANALALPVGLMSIALTGSRTAAVAVIPALLYGLSIVMRGSARMRLLVVIGLAVGVWAIQENVPDLTLTRILETPGNIAAGDFSYREETWLEGLQLFAEKPLLGVGVASFANEVPSRRSAHNVYVQAAAELGILGLLGIGVCTVIAVRASMKLYRRGEGVWLVSLVIYAAGAMTLSWSYEKITWLVLSLPLLAYQAYEDEWRRASRMARGTSNGVRQKAKTPSG